MLCKHETMKNIIMKKYGKVSGIYFKCEECGEIITLPGRLIIAINNCKNCDEGFHIESDRIIPCSCTNVNNYI